MDYRMSENYEQEILRLNKRVKELLAYSQKAAADNTKLLQENRDLKIHCNKYHQKYHNLREIHFKNQFQIQNLEDSRDAIYESNQKLKININKYLDMIRKQNDRIRQMEQSMKIQMMRKGVLERDNSPEIEFLKSENDRIKRESQDLHEKLNESYNIIDELEFELETLDFVEADRDHLQVELRSLRQVLQEMRSSSESSSTADATINDQQLFNQFRAMSVAAEDDPSNDDEEAPPRHSGSVVSGTEDEDDPPKPAFAAFAVAPEETEEEEEQHLPFTVAQSSSSDSQAEESTKPMSEWKLRRQELHKRLEILHKRQQEEH